MSSRENSNCPESVVREIWASRVDRKNIFMGLTQRRAVWVIFACALLICCGAILLPSNAPSAQEKSAAEKKPGSSGGGIAEAYRFNTLGVAYMNQQRPADAQKYFEQALAADPKLAVARLNLGVSLLAQQKLSWRARRLKQRRSSF